MNKMSDGINLILEKRITKEELQYGFSKREIQAFLCNRVKLHLDYGASRTFEYVKIARSLIIWCNKNCEGFYMVENIPAGDVEVSCFFFQLEEDLVLFKLTHEASDPTPNRKARK